MRSRYSAFACLGLAHRFSAQNLPDWLSYLEQTHSMSSNSDDERNQLEQFARQNDWLGLTIIDRAKGQNDDQDGMVEFIALYKPKLNQADLAQRAEQPKIALHEKSRFKRFDGKWQYVDGDIYPTSVSQAQTLSCRISRNDPCWCDSGKKLKKCHPN